MSELYEYVQGVFLVRAIVSVVASPRKPTFNVTAKGLSLENDHLSELAWPFFAIFGLLALGVGVAAWRYLFEPGVTELMLVVGLWSGFNLLIAGVALGAVAERAQADRHPRLDVRRKGILAVEGHRLSVEIENVSAGGCGIVVPALPPGLVLEPGRTRALLSIVPLAGTAQRDGVSVTMSHLARPGEPMRCGLAFAGLATADYPAVAELMYGDAGAIGRFLESRRKPIGLMAGSAQFAFWGLSEPVRALRYALLGKRPAAQADASRTAATPAAIAATFDTTAFGAAIETLAGQLRPPAPMPAGLDQAAWHATIAALAAPARASRVEFAPAEPAPLLAGAA